MYNFRQLKRKKKTRLNTIHRLGFSIHYNKIMNEHTFITINFNYYCFYLINFYIFNEQNVKHNMCQVLIFNINKLLKGLDCQ